MVRLFQISFLTQDLCEINTPSHFYAGVRIHFYFCSCFQVNSFTTRLLGLVVRLTDAWSKILFNVGTASVWIVRLVKGLNTCLSRLSLKLHSSGKLWRLLLISRWFTRSKCGRRRRSLHSPFPLLLPPALRAAVLRLFAFLSVNKCLSDPRRGV